MTPKEMFPLWLRICHALHALLVLVLAVSGFSIHLAGSGVPTLPFAFAVMLHNQAAVLILVVYVIYVALLVLTGDWRHYVPRWQGLRDRVVAQVRFYLVGLFQEEPPPFRPTPEQRLNPLQQVAYFVCMFGLFPLLAVTGLFLFFPGAAPERVAGFGGVWPMALAHTALAFAMVLFLVVHLYFALTASDPQGGLRAMLLGKGTEPPPRQQEPQGE